MPMEQYGYPTQRFMSSHQQFDRSSQNTNMNMPPFDEMNGASSWPSQTDMPQSPFGDMNGGSSGPSQYGGQSFGNANDFGICKSLVIWSTFLPPALEADKIAPTPAITPMQAIMPTPTITTIQAITPTLVITTMWFPTVALPKKLKYRAILIFLIVQATWRTTRLLPNTNSSLVSTDSNNGAHIIGQTQKVYKMPLWQRKNS